jgi:hypothetical protein
MGKTRPIELSVDGVHFNGSGEQSIEVICRCAIRPLARGSGLAPPASGVSVNGLAAAGEEGELIWKMKCRLNCRLG